MRMGNSYSQNFKSFAKKTMQLLGDEIRRWLQADNPLLRQICQEIIEASELPDPRV
jgi:hypothetical protein